MKKLIAFAGFAFVAAAAYYAIPQEQVVHNDQAEATLIIVAPSQGGNEYITLHESRSNIHWTAHSEQGRSTRGMVTFNRKNPDVSQSKAAASGLLSTVFERVDATVASSKDPDIRKLEGHPYFSLLLIEGIETRTVPILNFQQLKVLSLEFDSLIDPTEREMPYGKSNQMLYFLNYRKPLRYREAIVSPPGQRSKPPTPEWPVRPSKDKGLKN